MSQNRLQNAAQNLANEMVRSAERKYQETFNVTDSENRDTGERIIMLVIRTSSTRSRRIEEAVKSIDPMSTLPTGDRCPCCNGTGTV